MFAGASASPDIFTLFLHAVSILFSNAARSVFANRKREGEREMKKNSTMEETYWARGGRWLKSTQRIVPRCIFIDRDGQRQKGEKKKKKKKKKEKTRPTVEPLFPVISFSIR